MPQHVSPQAANPIHTVFPVNPYVVEALMSVKGKCVILETTRGRIEGTVAGVKPDHVIVQLHEKMAFVRIAEIVWIMPE
ncbi:MULTISPECIES: DUF2642 domain-containing protein [unclassified Paenibacillus]|uniref:DUF2642 domain-containing protein n=1 Tax=unclassified Paenibacillus TaxID=185978 RepID=UPI0009712D03|nr:MULTISPECIES: DUF2642 domain-containing protein [unclassified Paenibacillus]ASS69166.1 YuzF family protein [Paenibacillus sp. RUD330]